MFGEHTAEYISFVICKIGTLWGTASFFGEGGATSINHQNALTDCQDPSCFKNPRVTVCADQAPKWEFAAECGDNIDNDGDTLIDCIDPALFLMFTAAVLTTQSDDLPYVVASSVGQGRVVAVGDSSIAGDATNMLGLLNEHDAYHQTTLDNKIFLLNIVDWAAGN